MPVISLFTHAKFSNKLPEDALDVDRVAELHYSLEQSGFGLVTAMFRPNSLFCRIQWEGKENPAQIDICLSVSHAVTAFIDQYMVGNRGYKGTYSFRARGLGTIVVIRQAALPDISDLVPQIGGKVQLVKRQFPDL